MYTGILMKRKLTTSDLVTLQPGQTISTKIDLLKGYWFPQEGKYFISLKSKIHAFSGELCPKRLASHGLIDFTIFELTTPEVLPVEVLDIIAPPQWPESDLLNLGAPTPVNCDSTQVTNINTAGNLANTETNRVKTYQSKACNNASSSNYVVWMGVCDSTRYSTVTKNFNAISSRISAGYRVDCKGSSCSANVYAYVYPNDSAYNVYVCGAFWTASAAECKTDSRPGTIIHEISHFTAVAGTQDIQYGTSGCQNLAKTNPANAIKNADSHEYLAESCPT